MPLPKLPHELMLVVLSFADPATLHEARLVSHETKDQVDYTISSRKKEVAEIVKLLGDKLEPFLQIKNKSVKVCIEFAPRAIDSC